MPLIMDDLVEQEKSTLFAKVNHTNAATVVAAASAAATAMAAFVESLISLQVLKRLLPLLVFKKYSIYCIQVGVFLDMYYIGS